MPSYSLNLNVFSNACLSKSRTMSALQLFSIHLMVRSRFFFTSVRRRLNVSVWILSLICNRSESVQMPYSTILSRDIAFMPITLQICLMFLSIVIKRIDQIRWKWKWQQRGQRWWQLLQVQWFECSEWFHYDSDGFYGGFVCVSTGVLLCALRNVSFGEFFPDVQFWHA